MLKQRKKRKSGAAASTALASVMLLATLLAACSEKENDAKAPNEPAASGANEPANTPAEPAAQEPAAPEPATLRLLTDLSQAWPVKEDWAVWKWIKEKTNITIKQETQTGPESLALAVASGDMPDLMSVFPPDAQKYGPQGAFLDLSKHLDKMPHLKAFLEARPDVAQRMTSPGGEMYHVLNDGMGAGNQTVFFYRDDIFAKNSLEVPKTWEEMYETAKQLKKLYPDSYPFVFRHGINTLKYFGPSFGFYPEFYEDPATGKIKHGAADPGFKTLVEYLHKFYAEGLTPPDWLSMDYKAWTQFITTDKSFMTIQFIGQIEIMNAQLTDGAHLKFMAPPLGSGSQPYIPNTNFEEYGFAVSSTTKNLDAALRYLDFLYSDEGKELLSWGKEGETYTMVDGKRQFLPQFKEPNDLRKELGMFTTGAYGLADFEASKSLSNENEQYAYTEAAKYQFPVINALPPLTGEEKSAIANTEEQIRKYYETAVAKFIMGETPLTEWDAFLAELQKLGSQKLIDAYQIGLDRVKGAAK
ncbi:extracellular solute-binding protein [Paenibacillus sacheonensis]|uniref:Extracellular solute-binding protein n=1 Tax=Paenibacillus sacheonensis TaxID=742054 RepID=A0A7X5BWL3_9BACL|nr:extracellular solute-binding protein [Paenibacillus sacheonensis]MBM7564297.1 putative aldouronate transport system substrate-binding protein [Paenibacillus sacheonensis]NBC67381.1 extracellular solute-binding protein [Paenibacillus sacheonensis]